MPKMPIDIEEEMVVLENIKQLRRLLTTNSVTQADIRTYVAIVRHLLIDNSGALQRSAKKWSVVLDFECPDTGPLVRLGRNGYVFAYSASTIPIFGQVILGFVAYSSKKLPRGPNYDPSIKLVLNLASLLKQTVLHINGLDLTRADVLRYIAHKAGALHWDRYPDSSQSRITGAKMAALEKLRRLMRMSTSNGNTFMNVRSAEKLDSEEFKYTPETVDVVHLEFLALASVVSSSLGVQELAHRIEENLRNF